MSKPPGSRRRLAILDDYQRVALSFADWSAVERQFAIDVFADHLADRDALVQRLAPYEVLVVMRERTPLDRDLIARLPKLKLVVTTGARNRAIDIAACAARGIAVSATGSGPGGTVELTWGLIFALTRHIAAEDRAIRAGGWQISIGESLEGKVLGVVGLGRIGGKVAEIATRFGAEVLAWSQNLTAERARSLGARQVERDELMARSDVVTLHLVLSERTRHVIGAREIGLMKPTALLVNTARGGLVDEAALVQALATGRIAGAGLDTYAVEPLPVDHPLRALPNTVLTPHIGYVVKDNFRMYYRDAVEDILAWLAGTPIRVLEPDPG